MGLFIYDKINWFIDFLIYKIWVIVIIKILLLYVKKKSLMEWCHYNKTINS